MYTSIQHHLNEKATTTLKKNLSYYWLLIDRKISTAIVVALARIVQKKLNQLVYDRSSPIATKWATIGLAARCLMFKLQVRSTRIPVADRSEAFLFVMQRMHRLMMDECHLGQSSL